MLWELHYHSGYESLKLVFFLHGPAYCHTKNLTWKLFVSLNGSEINCFILNFILFVQTLTNEQNIIMKYLVITVVDVTNFVANIFLLHLWSHVTTASSVLLILLLACDSSEADLVFKRVSKSLSLYWSSHHGHRYSNLLRFNLDIDTLSFFVCFNCIIVSCDKGVFLSWISAWIFWCLRLRFFYDFLLLCSYLSSLSFFFLAISNLIFRKPSLTSKPIMLKLSIAFNFLIFSSFCLTSFPFDVSF